MAEPSNGPNQNNAKDSVGIPSHSDPEQRAHLFFSSSFRKLIGKKDKRECPLCSLLPTSLPPPGHEIPNAEYFFGLEMDGLEELDYQRWSCVLYHTALDLYSIWVLKGSRGPNRNLLQGSCHESGYICTEIDIFNINLIGRGAFVDKDPLSPIAVKRMRRWMETCNNIHPKCKQSIVSRLPTRILDVGDPESTFNVTLVEPHDKSANYVALSHCWGSSNPFIMTRDNREDMMKTGFNLDEIPATFRDAIIITRKMGIRYLWIDSLCIIQKDADDWDKESALMGMVYGNASLTIAAENASADEEGFLKPRPTAFSSLEVIYETGHIAKFYYRRPLYQNSKNSHSLEGGALRSRGWTLQEAYLSRRLLRFYDSRIIWTCQECTFDEGAHDENKRQDELDSIDLLYPSGSYAKKSFPTHQRWYDMIEGYSARKLSFESDRFPALSGLASIYAEHESQQYLAGIWWGDALYGLYWSPTAHLLKKPELYVAPSWSWASVVGSVAFHNAKSPDVELGPMRSVTLIDYDIQHRGANNFGQIDGGWIRLQAPLAAIECLDQNNAAGFSGAVDEDDIRFDFEKPAGELWLLFLMRDLRNSDALEHHDIMDLLGIVVRRVEDISLKKYEDAGAHKLFQAYERVGCFDLERYMSSANKLVKRLNELVMDIVLI
ncbi:hypothetical protein IFR05_012148 [Cadophora sp. M221]|nr:hypothetical protein IFR05_012148 [Cadophora sp. M221]